MFNSVRMVRIFVVGSALTGCFGGPGFLTQKETGSQSINFTVSTEGERTSATVSASATTALNINAGEGSSIAGAQVKIPPGALSIDANIFMEESDTLASGLVGQNLGITLNQAAGKSVIVSVSGQMPTLNNPLTLSLPLAGAGLRLLAEDQAIVIVFRAYENDKTVEGVIPFSKLKIEGNAVVFDITRFGAYQPVFIPSSEMQTAEAAKVVETENKVLTKTEITALPKAEISLLTISVAGRIAHFDAKVTGASIKSCSIEMIETNGARTSWSTAAKSSGSKTFSDNNAAINAKARMSCLLVDGRNLVSAFASFTVAAPEAVPQQPNESNNPPTTPSNEIEVISSYSLTPEDNGKIIKAMPPAALTTEITLPKLSDVVESYNIEIRNKGTGFVKINPNGGYLNGNPSPFYLYATNASVKITKSASVWNSIDHVGEIGRQLCDEVSGYQCYNAAFANDIYIGTPSYKVLKLEVLTSLYIRTDALDGSPNRKILRADGADAWQKKLDASGTASSSAMTYAEANNAGIQGIACPTSVFMDDGMKFASNLCMYYTNVKTFSGFASTGLPTVEQKWFAGNISTCGELGMRLPTIYEVASGPDTYQYFPIADETPTTWGGMVIPTATDPIATATASIDAADLLLGYSQSGDFVPIPTAYTQADTRCVVHSGW